MTSSWFFLSTLNYDARSTTHQIYKPVISYFPTSEFLIYFFISHFCFSILSSLPDPLHHFCSAVVFLVVQVSVSCSLLALHYDSSVFSVPRARSEPANTLFEQRNNMCASHCTTIRICKAWNLHAVPGKL